MNQEVFLQIFNMELNPEWAYISGKIGISGSLYTASKLNSVLKAAAESSKNSHKKPWFQKWTFHFLQKHYNTENIWNRIDLSFLIILKRALFHIESESKT